MNETLKKRLFKRLVILLENSIEDGLWGEARDIAEELQTFRLNTKRFESLKNQLFQYYREIA